jgi:hypothetical protein
VGNRANVYIHEGDRPGVYLYTHWDGTELPQYTRDAMATERAKNRREDTAYFTRIVFEYIINAHGAIGLETGYGISADVGDGEDRIVDIDTSYGGEVRLIGYPYDWDDIPDNPYAYED